MKIKTPKSLEFLAEHAIATVSPVSGLRRLEYDPGHYEQFNKFAGTLFGVLTSCALSYKAAFDVVQTNTLQESSIILGSILTGAAYEAYRSSKK